MGKDAKTAEKKKEVFQGEYDSSKLVMITGDGHKVANTVDGYAICGVERIGWRFGEDRHVSCKFCRDGVRQDDLVVPPGQFELTDEDIAELPVLDVEGLDTK